MTPKSYSNQRVNFILFIKILLALIVTGITLLDSPNQILTAIPMIVLLLSLFINAKQPKGEKREKKDTFWLRLILCLVMLGIFAFGLVSQKPLSQFSWLPIIMYWLFETEIMYLPTNTNDNHSNNSK